MFEFLDEQNVCGKQLHVAMAGGPADGLTMVLSRENLHDYDRLRTLLAQRFPGSVRLVDGIGAVSVIGAGINSSYNNVRAGSAALAGRGLLGISTSSFRITWLAPLSAMDDAVRALHKTFMEMPVHPVP